MIYYKLTSEECENEIFSASMQISVVENNTRMLPRQKEISIGIYTHQIELLKERKEHLEIRDQE